MSCQRVKTIIFWLLAILCRLVLLLIFTISFFYTLSESSLIISGPDIHFPFLSLPLEMPSFLSQSEFDGNDECSLITWRFWKASAEFHYTQAPSEKACITCGSPHKPSGSALSNLGSALLSIPFADGNSLFHVRGMGNFLAYCPYVQV